MEAETLRTIHSKHRTYYLIEWRKFKKFKRKNAYCLDGKPIIFDLNENKVTFINSIAEFLFYKSNIEFKDFIIPLPKSIINKITTSFFATSVLINGNKNDKRAYPYFKNKSEYLKWKLKH